MIYSTASDIDSAGLVVERELLQLHGTLETEREALREEHATLGEYANELVGHSYGVALGVLRVAEEGVRCPHFVHQVVVKRDVLDVLPRRVRVHETRVMPLLTEVAVHYVLLYYKKCTF